VNSRATGTPGFLETVLAAFDRAEVRWALLRGKVRGRVTGRDVDLLIAGDDLGPAEDVIFAMGGVALPRARRPWHRFYLLRDPRTRERVVLDVVSELIYGAQLRIPSGLGAGCVDRRTRDGTGYVLDPTDMFWTVLLHCLLDKDHVAERRRAELADTVEKVKRPSPGEAFFEGLCPQGWSADRAIEAVAAHDWDALAMLGRQLSPRAEPTTQTESAVELALQGEPAADVPRRRMRRAAGAVYPLVWRAVGLGVTPHILDVAETASADAIVVSLSRRPGICEVVLLVPEEQKGRLVAALQKHHYWRALGRWNRMTHVGVERIDAISPSQLAASGRTWEDLRRSSSPMPGRIHCRRASAGTRSLIAAMAAAGRQPEPLIQDGRSRMKVVERAGESRATAFRNPRARRVIVSFSGLDGAGKTRQIDALAAAAGQHHSVDVLWLPTKVWPEPLLNRLPAGPRSRLGPKRRTVVSDTADHGSRGGQGARMQNVSATAGGRSFADAVRSAVWFAVATVAAASVGLSLRRRASSSSADLLVLDRYRLDSLVKLQFWYPDVSQAWLGRVVGALAPAPDVEFLLCVDPAVAYARKPEQWSVRQLARQARLYDRLAAGPMHVVALDAQRDVDDVAREVLSQVGPILDGC
jgi:thymidylate kinase